MPGNFEMIRFDKTVEMATMDIHHAGLALRKDGVWMGMVAFVTESKHPMPITFTIENARKLAQYLTDAIKHYDTQINNAN